MSRHGKDLSDVLAALDVRDVFLVGWLDGGERVWAYLDLFRSDLVRGVVSVDQTPRMVNTTEWPLSCYGLDDADVSTFFAEGIPPTGREWPVQIVAGRESQPWLCEHAAETVRDNPLGRSMVLDDAGHGVNIDQPDACNDRLLSFLRDP